jgi:hypothetical protein
LISHITYRLNIVRERASCKMNMKISDYTGLQFGYKEHDDHLEENSSGWLKRYGAEWHLPR